MHGEIFPNIHVYAWCICKVILKDFENASIVLLILAVRILDISEKNICELKSTDSLLNHNTKAETSTPVINIIHNEFKRYPEFNRRKIFIRYNIISGKKPQRPSKCCWLAFICTKIAVTSSL